MRLNEIKQTYYHGSINLEIGKSYISNKATKTFGDYEDILEKYRPKDKPSRLHSFYLTPDKDHAERFGFVYEVFPLSKVAKCYFGWLSILMEVIPPGGYDKNSGYIVSLQTKHRTELAEKFAKLYWSGKKPTVKDFEQYGMDIDGESFDLEVLCRKIRVIDEVD